MCELGVTWNPVAEIFQFTPPSIEGFKKTKRGILACIAKLFDPCG